MPRNMGLTYAERRTEEHGDEQLQHQTEDSRDGRDSGYDAANQHLVKFHNELKSINEDTALDFEKQKNPAEYSLEERKEALEAHLDAFRSTDWKNLGERREAADDIAQSVFQPMYSRINLADAASQYQLPQQFLDELRNENIEYLEVKLDDEGNERLEMRAKDIETANRLVEASQGSFQVSSTRVMDNCRDQFADALYNDRPGAMEEMEKAMDNGVRYYQGDTSWFTQQQEMPDGHNPLYWNQRPAEEQSEREKLEASYREKLAFNNLQAMDEFSLDEAVNDIVSQKLFHIQEYSDWVRENDNGTEARAILEVNEALHDMAREIIRKDVEQGNEEGFVDITRVLEQASTDLANEMAAGNGFVQSEGYRTLTMPSGRNGMDNGDYMRMAANTREKANDHHDGMNSLNHQILDKLEDKLLHQTRTVEEMENEAGIPGYLYEREREKQWELASAMQYLMRGKDPEYWTIDRMTEDNREQTMQSRVEHAITRSLSESGVEQRDDKYQLDGPRMALLGLVERAAANELHECRTPERYHQILGQTYDTSSAFLEILESNEHPLTLKEGHIPGMEERVEVDLSQDPGELQELHGQIAVDSRQFEMFFKSSIIQFEDDGSATHQMTHRAADQLVNHFLMLRSDFKSQHDPDEWKGTFEAMQDTADAIRALVHEAEPERVAVATP